MLQTCAEPLFVSNPAGCGYPFHPSYSHVRTTARAKPKATERQERQEGRNQEGAEEVSFDSILTIQLILVFHSKRQRGLHRLEEQDVRQPLLRQYVFAFQSQIFNIFRTNFLEPVSCFLQMYMSQLINCAVRTCQPIKKQTMFSQQKS
ncbi:Hypothetical_protein [Hexamita inflata]|uniref:Hypothetical_protein n=1 Tax=Hexamita inflata TaxID=28002 RepID=A0ABP1HHS4_9EUKA